MNTGAGVDGTGRVTVKNERGVAVMLVDRPPANALDLQLVRDLAAGVAAAAQDPSVGAAVITGAGRRFIAGADIKMLNQLAETEFPPFISTIQRAFDDLEAAPLPTIAAINGHAMGGGLELALACDLRLIAEGVMIGLPEAKLGLLPAAGGTQRLVETVGKGRALEMLYTGRALTAGEALAFGIVNRVVPAETLLEEAIALAADLAGGARQALAAIKGCVVARLDGGRRAGARAEAAGAARLFPTYDAREGIAAFVEKRRPSFGGFS